MKNFNTNTANHDEWLTPPEIILDLGPFDLDPCSPINKPWATAKNHFTVDDNGLLQSWDGFVWMNPPYGKALEAWLNKIALHGNGIALVFARTETKAFQDWVFPFATSIFFVKGRIQFYKVDGSKGDSANAPSVLIAYGSEADKRLQRSKIKGKYIKL